jgi:hypothetical protein
MTHNKVAAVVLVRKALMASSNKLDSNRQTSSKWRPALHKVLQKLPVAPAVLCAECRSTEGHLHSAGGHSQPCTAYLLLDTTEHKDAAAVQLAAARARNLQTHNQSPTPHNQLAWGSRSAAP